MQYRPFGKTGEKVSVVSLGCMRFEDEAQAVAVVSSAVDHGVNYFESSCQYCGGQSEGWLGKALGDRRGQVMVSTKSPPGEEGFLSADEVRKSIDESLRNLGVDCIDFYHAWRVNSPERYESCRRKGGWLDGVRKAVGEGIVKHLGITSHSTPDHIMAILADDIFEAVTVQYSVILPAYRQVVDEARQRNVGVVVMGPLAGGLLAESSPILEQAFFPDDPIAGALKYVLSDAGVSTVASGMMSPREVEANCRAVAELSRVVSPGYQERVEERLRTALGEELCRLESAFCNGCRYCNSVCPEGLRPFDVFKPYNLVLLKGAPGAAEETAKRAGIIAEACTQCRTCEAVCPQHLNIPEHLECVKNHFSK